ncbi:hypothetical protein YSY43_16830 [Paenibacillus sp. YSY-4.3]
MKAILDAQGKPLWIPGQKQGFFETFAKPSVTMGRLLQNLKHPEAEYILLIEVKDEVLRQTLSNLKMGSSGEVRILTADNIIVHAADQELIETTSYIGLNEQQLLSGEAFFTAENDDGVEQLVAYRQLQSVDWRIIGYAPESDFLSAADKLIWMTAFVLCFAILVALAIGYYLFRMVGKPLMKLCRLMEEGERGNLRVRTNFQSRDEIGRLGQSFNSMLEQISLLVEKTNTSTGELLSNAEHLARASKDTSQFAGEIASATGEFAAGAANLAMEAEKGVDIADEIGQQMDNVMSLNAAMDASAGRVIEVSRQGREYMDSLVEKTESVSQMTGLIEANSARLSESTHSIRNILAPMVEMTKQTNILSLNASIEASRAGAAGKGFVVIAEEIRKLAAESNESIQTVSAMTEEIQAAIEDTVNVLMQVTPMYGEQLLSVKDASSIFQRVVQEMEQFVSEHGNWFPDYFLRIESYRCSH